jgi:hypothetical protein
MTSDVVIACSSSSYWFDAPGFLLLLAVPIPHHLVRHNHLRSAHSWELDMIPGYEWILLQGPWSSLVGDILGKSSRKYANATANSLNVLSSISTLFASCVAIVPAENADSFQWITSVDVISIFLCSRLKERRKSDKEQLPKPSTICPSGSFNRSHHYLSIVILRMHALRTASYSWRSVLH